MYAVSSRSEPVAHLVNSLSADFCFEVTRVDCVTSAPGPPSSHLVMPSEWRAQKRMVHEPEGCLRHTHQLRYFDAAALHVAQGPEMQVVGPHVRSAWYVFAI